MLHDINSQQSFDALPLYQTAKENMGAHGQITCEPAISRHDVPDGTHWQSLLEHASSTKSMRIGISLGTRATQGPPLLLSRATREDGIRARHCSITSVVMPPHVVIVGQVGCIQLHRGGGEPPQ
jgi:hypothetical protein